MKRGQVTLFIIISLLVLTAIVLTLYTQREIIKSFFEERITRLEQIPAEIQPVENHVKFCMEDTAKLSLKLISLQGGYFEPKEYIEMESYNVAYWYDQEDTSPSLNIIRGEIVESMNYLLSGCIISFEEDYEIEVKEIKPTIDFKEDKIIVSANTNIIVNHKNISHDLKKDYGASFESEFNNLYNSAKEIVNSEKINPENIDLTLLAELEKDINFFRFKNVIVYSLSGEELTLMFANKF